MRFLLAIYKYNPFGGLQRDTLRLIQELTGRGHEVIVFTTAYAEYAIDDDLVLYMSKSLNRKS